MIDNLQDVVSATVDLIIEDLSDRSLGIECVDNETMQFIKDDLISIIITCLYREIKNLGEITVGDYTLNRINDSSVFIRHKDGEGMELLDKVFISAIKQMFLDYF